MLVYTTKGSYKLKIKDEPMKMSWGGVFKVILVGTGVQLKLRKHSNAYIAI
jgi:hypothetical protein